MRSLHAAFFWVAVVSTGLVGLWGVVLAATRRTAGPVFRVAMYGASAVMLIQVLLGLGVYSQGHRPADDFHLFYGFLILFSFSFAYIYRSQMARHLALAWGLLLLFVMGLGLRAWVNVG